MKNKLLYTSLYALMIGGTLALSVSMATVAFAANKSYDSVKEAYGDTLWDGLETNKRGRGIVSLQKKLEEVSNKYAATTTAYNQLRDRLEELEKRNGGEQGEGEGLQKELDDLNKKLSDDASEKGTKLNNMLTQVINDCNAAYSRDGEVGKLIVHSVSSDPRQMVSDQNLRQIADCATNKLENEELISEIGEAAAAYRDAYDEEQNSAKRKEIEAAIAELERLSGEDGDVAKAYKEYDSDRDKEIAAENELRDAYKSMMDGLSTDKKEAVKAALPKGKYDVLFDTTWDKSTTSELQQKFNGIAEQTGLNSEYFDLSTDFGRKNAQAFYEGLYWGN